MSGKKVVIIGSGIGGMACGALLAHRGFEVLVLEKNSLIGGRCATYEKDGFRVDVGVHLFGEGPNGPLDEVCRRTGAQDSIKWTLARNPRPTLNYMGQNIVYSTNTMVDMLPKSEVGNVFKMFAAMMQMNDEQTRKLDYVSLGSYIGRFTQNEMVRILLSGMCGQYLCVHPDEASAGEFIRCFRGVAAKKTSAYPLGGCISIPGAYESVIKKHGGEVRVNSVVKRIVIENGKVSGVELKDGYVEADAVISNADIKNTVLKLAGEKHFPPEYIERIKKLKYSQHVVAVKVALDEKITDQKLVLYLPVSYEESESYMNDILKGKIPERVGGMITSPTNYDPALAPAGKQLLFFGSGCLPHQNWKKWEERLMSSLEFIFPGVSRHILWHELTTPDDINRFAGEEGCVIGVAQTVGQVSERRPPQVTPLKGLYAVGAGEGGTGIGAEMAASSAMELAEKIL